MAKESKQDKNDANRAIMELQMYDQQLRQMEEQARMVEQQVYEHEVMILALENLKGKNGSETMIPLGPGLFVKGKIEDTEKVYIHVGNKIIASKKVEEAIKIIEKRRDQTMESADKISTQMQKILMKMTAIESKMQGHSAEHVHGPSCNHGECEDEDCSGCGHKH